jgi:hypothetical protein
MTNEEHKIIHIKKPTKIYDVDLNLSLFVDAEVAGWHQTKTREGAFMRNLCELHQIKY